MQVLMSVASSMILQAAVLAWTVSQGCKILLSLFLGRSISLGMIMGSGGFPSSHTASVLAMTVQVGQIEGWETTLFAVCLILSFIVMYDAAGVRREAGEHAYLINEIIDRLDLSHIRKNTKKVEAEKKRLKELIGHTPFEVFGGAVIGVLIALIF